LRAAKVGLNNPFLGRVLRKGYTSVLSTEGSDKYMDIGETLLVTSRQEWRNWLSQHHADHKEIWLIYYKKSSGKSGISYEESVEEALCFGWIDGAFKGIDEETYAGRFTPRRAKSPWSASNRARVARLLQEGRMTDAGLAVLPEDLRG
jgi:uncharacterized protein YdeI (YjbR/CyaY-like superfamily)